MNAKNLTQAVGMVAGMAIFAGPATAAGPFDLDREPILMIGASFVNGNPPFSDDLLAPLGGGAVNSGRYLSLGDAMIAVGVFVVNEAQSGATSFDRDFCGPDSCAPFGWQGYDTQLQKALARVGGENAKYVWIGLGNDCLHSGASDEPWGAPPHGACSLEKVDAYVDRVIAVAGLVRSAGLTPIFPLYPDYEDLDLPLFQQSTGLPFVADEGQFNRIADTWERRLTTEAPGAIVVDAWGSFEHLGDGLHPTPRTSLAAALRVVQAIREHERPRP